MNILADTTSLTKTIGIGLANVAGTDPVLTSTGLITVTGSGGFKPITPGASCQ